MCKLLTILNVMLKRRFGAVWLWQSPQFPLDFEDICYWIGPPLQAPKATSSEDCTLAGRVNCSLSQGSGADGSHVSTKMPRRAMVSRL